MIKNFCSLFVVVLTISVSALSLGCSGEPSSEMTLTMMCKDKKVATSGNRGASFVFKAEDEYGAPVTDLDAQSSGKFLFNFDVRDGGESTGYESVAYALKQPQNMALRTLILLDGSESLFGQDMSIKKAVTDFLEKHFAIAGVMKEVAIYKFYGSNTITKIQDFSSDKQVLLDALNADQITREGTSTALYDAVRSALTVVRGTPTYPTGMVPALTARTLVVFTDGRDEVYSGADADSAQSSALSQATDFKKNSDNTILVAGIDRGNNVLDADFLDQLASDGNYVEESDLSKLGTVFSKFAETAAAKTKKYYQFNLCSNRRRGAIAATLDVQHQSDGRHGSLSFNYNADGFMDGACDNQNLPTCDWSVNGVTNPSPTPTPSPSNFTLNWGFGIGSPNGMDMVSGTVKTADGSTFISGDYSQSYILGSTVLPQPPTNAHYPLVAKINSNGTVAWAKSLAINAFMPGFGKGFARAKTGADPDLFLVTSPAAFSDANRYTLHRLSAANGNSVTTRVITEGMGTVNTFPQARVLTTPNAVYLGLQTGGVNSFNGTEVSVNMGGPGLIFYKLNPTTLAVTDVRWIVIKPLTNITPNLSSWDMTVINEGSSTEGLIIIGSFNGLAEAYTGDGTKRAFVTGNSADLSKPNTFAFSYAAAPSPLVITGGMITHPDSVQRMVTTVTTLSDGRIAMGGGYDQRQDSNGFPLSAKGFISFLSGPIATVTSGEVVVGSTVPGSSFSAVTYMTAGINGDLIYCGNKDGIFDSNIGLINDSRAFLRRRKMNGTEDSIEFNSSASTYDFNGSGCTGASFNSTGNRIALGGLFHGKAQVGNVTLDTSVDAVIYNGSLVDLSISN